MNTDCQKAPYQSLSATFIVPKQTPRAILSCSAGTSSSLSGSNQAAHQAWLFLPDPAQGQSQHQDQCQAAAHRHLPDPANGMLFKTKAGVQSAVDPFHRSPMFVFPDEFIAAAVNRIEYTVIRLQRYPNTTLTAKRALYRYTCEDIEGEFSYPAILVAESRLLVTCIWYREIIRFIELELAERKAGRYLPVAISIFFIP